VAEHAGEPETCGQGLAGFARVPAALAALLTVVADNLEAHVPALDPSDPVARQEAELYGGLVTRHRELAAALEQLRDDLAGARDLPMGRHDQRVLGGAPVVDALRRLVDTEAATIGTLTRRHADDAALLRGALAAG